MTLRIKMKFVKKKFKKFYLQNIFIKYKKQLTFTRNDSIYNRVTHKSFNVKK